MNKELEEKLKKLGLKSARIGGTGTMRMKAKKRRRKDKTLKPEEEKEPQLEKMNMESLDQDIQNLETQLKEIKIEK